MTRAALNFSKKLKYANGFVMKHSLAMDKKFLRNRLDVFAQMLANQDPKTPFDLDNPLVQDLLDDTIWMNSRRSLFRYNPNVKPFNVPVAVPERMKLAYTGTNFKRDFETCMIRYSPLWSAHELVPDPKNLAKVFEQDQINLEGFSNPFTAVHSNFCSAFDEDKLFGSRGSFFKYHMPPGTRAWLNPPFVEQLIVKTVDHVLDQLSATDDISCTLFLPDWSDMESIARLCSSPYYKGQTLINAGTYTNSDYTTAGTRDSAVDRVLYHISNV